MASPVAAKATRAARRALTTVILRIRSQVPIGSPLLESPRHERARQGSNDGVFDCNADTMRS